MDELKLKSDAACKRVLSIKGIAAYILKDCLEEFHECTLLDVMNSLNHDASSQNIQSLNTEDLSKPDAKLVYDVLSKAVGPDQKELFINLEPQGKINSRGSILYRVIYVMARMITRQKNDNEGFRNSEFEQMKKCVCIWIVLDPPKGMKGSQVDAKESMFKTTRGTFAVPEDANRMQRAYIMCLTDEIDVNDKSALMMLSVLFNDKMSIQDRVLCLKNHYGIVMNEEEKDEVETMSETWRGFYGRGVTYGIEKGKVLGIEQGKALGIEQGKVLGIEHGKILGIEQGNLQVAKKMLMHGMDEELIVKMTGLSYEQIKQIERELSMKH